MATAIRETLATFQQRAHTVLGNLLSAMPSSIEACSWKITDRCIEAHIGAGMPDVRTRDAIRSLADLFVLAYNEASDDGYGSRSYVQVTASGTVDAVQVMFWAHVKPACGCGCQHQPAGSTS